MVNLTASLALLSFMACGGNNQGNTANNADEANKRVVNVPQFNADSAFYFVKAQVDFGPRAMNTAAHDACGDYLAAKLEQYGAKVYNQRTDLPSYEGKMLKARNIIGAFNPDAKKRVALFSHWDSRPWADNDPDASKHYTPILGANDGASGVGVLLEVARQLQAQAPAIGIDIIFHIIRKVWKAAQSIGYNNYFVAQGGGGATDDHLFINQIARIPTIDIIPTSQQYTFFEHWHTVKDDMDVITVPTLKAVGQTILQVIYNEK